MSIQNIVWLMISRDNYKCVLGILRYVHFEDRFLLYNENIARNTYVKKILSVHYNKKEADYEVSSMIVRKQLDKKSGKGEMIP